jgi:predicted RNA-binding Zn-ribbon protein involved in translation (DUF1610 family)
MKNIEDIKIGMNLKAGQSTQMPDKKTLTNAFDAEDKIELERREAYIEPKTRDLLRKLLQGGDKEEIAPIYIAGSGYAYQITHKQLDKNETDTISKEFLENLTQLNILEVKFFDSVSSCPNCQSTILTLHNRCPKCKSHNVGKTSLTEHIPCGYIDQKEKYVNDRCPKCGEILIEGQYRNMGRWYVCGECRERFENPEFDLICRSCNNKFAIKEARINEIPKFTLNLARKKEIRQNVASLENIKDLLSELGFHIEMPGLTIGLKSGMQHHFSLLAKKQVEGQEIVIALDHAVSESEVSASPLILYIYKISEVNVDVPIFIATPQLNDTARKIAQGHRILLIEGSTEEKKVMEDTRTEIQARIDQKISELTSKQDEEKPETSSFLNKLGIKKKSSSQSSSSKPE